MGLIKARKVKVDGDRLSISTQFRNFPLEKSAIASFKVGRISSLFDEIGIEVKCEKTFLVTERVSGFFELAKFLCVEEAFGPLWYRDAEDGRQLEQICVGSGQFR